jgi:G8 domain/FG-GAP-like repeat
MQRTNVGNVRYLARSFELLSSLVCCIGLTTPLHAVPLDISGDNRTDIIYVDSGGGVNALTSAGGSVSAPANLLAANSGWRVTHSADLNGDAKADLLLANSDGRIAVLIMDGVAVQNFTTLIGANSGWRLIQTADLNGDSKSDLLLENADGRIAAMIMNGTTIQSFNTLVNPGSGWHLTHTGDLNGDTQADLILTHDDGSTVALLMNGATVTSASYLINAGSPWRVTHLADLNGDGKADLIIRHHDSSAAILTMNGTTVTRADYLLTTGSSWIVSHTGDLNGDNKADLFLTHNDGSVVVLLMNGSLVTQASYLLTANSPYAIAQTGDYNGDGKTDVILHHTDGSAIIATLSGGADGTSVTGLINLWPASNGAAARETLPPGALLTGSRWSDPTTWGGAIPAAGQQVTIPAGRRIILDVSPPPLKSLLIEGQLAMDPDKDINLTADWIIVTGQGAKLSMGNQASAYRRRATITLTGTNPNENIMGMGTKVLGAMSGGKIELYGESRLSWTQLGASAAKGASTITLKENVGWRVGERIVIASTAMDPNEAEERTISSVSGGVVTLSAPLSFSHYGQLQSYDGKTADQRAEVALLSRNIVIQGDDASMSAKFGGHTMIMGSNGAVRESNPALRASAKIRGVEFRKMGQFDRLGRYPLHWHFNDDSIGDFVEGSSVHQSIQRGIVVHQSDQVAVRNNVVFNTPGHAYVVETGTEKNTVFERNLGILPRATTFTQTALKDQADDAAATFWLRTAALTLIGNHSAGGEFAGFWFDMSFVDGANATKSALVFRDNTAHSHQGKRVPNTESDTWAFWHTDGYVPSDEGVLVFDRVNAFKNARAVETKGRGVTTNSILADNGLALSNQILRDSMVISRTANTDTDQSWGETGLFAYGGHAHAENVTWVNFNSGRKVSRTLTCGIEYPRFSLRGTRLIDSDLSAGCGDVIMHDIDGSFSGSGVPQKLISYNANSQGNSASSFGLITRDCALRPAAGVAVCPNFDYRGLSVTYPTGAGFSNPEWYIDVVRDEDGNRVTPEHFRWISYVVPGKVYRLEVKNARNAADPAVYPLQSLSDVTLGLDYGDLSEVPVPGGRNTVFDPAWSGRTVLVYAIAPAGAFSLRRCARGDDCNFDQTKWQAVSAAPSLGSLQSQTAAGYFLDTGANRLYFRLSGGELLRFQR